MTTKATKKPVTLEKKAHPYNEAEHKADVVALLDKIRALPGAPRWAEVKPLGREIRAHLSVRIGRAELSALLAERVAKPAPRFMGRLTPREAATLRTILRHGPEVRVRFHRDDPRSTMKVWIASKGFERGNVLSRAACMRLREKGILLRETSGISGGDIGLFKLAPRAAEPGMFWVQ